MQNCKSTHILKVINLSEIIDVELLELIKNICGQLAILNANTAKRLTPGRY